MPGFLDGGFPDCLHLLRLEADERSHLGFVGRRWKIRDRGQARTCLCGTDQAVGVGLGILPFLPAIRLKGVVVGAVKLAVPNACQSSAYLDKGLPALFDDGFAGSQFFQFTRRKDREGMDRLLGCGCTI